MRLYVSVGPNPRVVRMALAEKGLRMDTEVVDIMRGDNRRASFTALNPAGQTPALAFDDGRILAESVAIVEYLDEIHPEPPLLGTSPEERALTRMWVRRLDFAVVQPLTAGFRAAEGLPLFQSRMRCFPEAADSLKAAAREGLEWVEAQTIRQAYLIGGQIRLPDLVLYSFLDFGKQVGQPLPPGNTRLAEWFARMALRPSARETANPPA